MISIGYFADGPWSHKAFELLVKDKEITISFICVRYDTKDFTLLKHCEEYGIDYLKTRNVNSKEFINTIKGYGCQLLVSMSFNQIFKKELINLTKYKIINCHAGKLPYYRGRNILNWVLINDEKEFGITVHFVDEGIDTGDIILQRTYLITDKDDYATLLKLSYRECANILFEAINLFKKNTFKRVKQVSIDKIGFYCTQRKIGDEKLNWNQTSRSVFNFVRAICQPGPMARTRLNGYEMCINKVEYIGAAKIFKGVVGAILLKSNDGFLVKTQDSFIKVTEFDYSKKIKVGDRFEIN